MGLTSVQNLDFQQETWCTGQLWQYLVLLKDGGCVLHAQTHRLHLRFKL